MTIISNVKQTIATLKGIEAQLSILALNSQEEEAQKAFHDMMLLVEEVKNDLQSTSRNRIRGTTIQRILGRCKKHVRLDTHFYSLGYFYCCINRDDKNPRKKADIGNFLF